ncbi:hypothetical protein GCM10009616_34060 [Microlunatus lacustris]
MPTSAGLDLDTLRGFRHSPRNLHQLRHRVEVHLDQAGGYVAFSGGKDSLVALHLTLAVEPDIPVVFFDSGLEFPETYTYLSEVADRWRLNLNVVAATHTTLEILAATGAWDHHATPAQCVPDLHQVLISEPAARAHNLYGPGEIWGVRAQESRGRAAAYANGLRAEQATTCRGCCSSPQDSRAHHGGLIRRVDGTTAFGPVWDWKTDEIWGYIARHHLPPNPVYAKLRRLGAPEHFLRVSHMLDATRLEEGRVTWLRRGWPAIFEDLAAVLPRIREFL